MKEPRLPYIDQFHICLLLVSPHVLDDLVANLGSLAGSDLSGNLNGLIVMQHRAKSVAKDDVTGQQASNL